jgi:Lrp/AsnC family leucine-responsive transcriptional regulator
MLDNFDHALLNEVQRDDSRTADALAQIVPLSPSAIARRLRRLRAGDWIARTIALLSAKVTGKRLHAIVTIVLDEHANHAAIDRLREGLMASEAVQWAYEISGASDIIALIDCPDMASFNQIAERIIVADPAVRRYETASSNAT